jgi:hypothetical protein
VPFDPECQIPDHTLRQILQAEGWMPTPHHMRNFDIIGRFAA